LNRSGCFFIIFQSIHPSTGKIIKIPIEIAIKNNKGVIILLFLSELNAFSSSFDLLSEIRAVGYFTTPH